MLTLLFTSFLVASFVFALETYRCEPFQTAFESPSTISNINDANPFASPFVALTPPETYATSPDRGLTLRLLPPHEPVTRNGSVNDKLGVGATINSTFTVGLGSMTTFEIESAKQAGSIVAAIWTDANDNLNDTVRRDEIDWELISADQKAYQTNFYAPTESDPSPHYGSFGQRNHTQKGTTISETRRYSILLAEDRIEWAVDGAIVRTQTKESSYIAGSLRWPRHNFVISLGIWDGSGAQGTSHWAKGPIIWEAVLEPIEARVKVTVECF
ncbi:concanavalin A-like lectin/glucanase [Marasmius fiardii PR-910]|nr:concanavalin A-like lectin/glucanase [Marasmius fiardii PR-910]